MLRPELHSRWCESMAMDHIKPRRFTEQMPFWLTQAHVGMKGNCCACRAEHFAHVGVLHAPAMRSVKELMLLCTFVDGVCTLVALPWAAVWHDLCESAMFSYTADILCIARVPATQPAHGGAHTLLCVLDHGGSNDDHACGLKLLDMSKPPRWTSVNRFGAAGHLRVASVLLDISKALW